VGGGPACAGAAPEEGGDVGSGLSLSVFCTLLWCATVPCNNLTIACEGAGA